ncbi:EAL domain-containing protein [Lysobacter capsici]|jgi:diguanylate cyclase (GGDEF)-like protein/PAS domain S-box-containing protein|uniref:Two-component system response regulator n=1 Tax=Lysobacter capsici AZ78 TaxID=1444315 RepID=A0A108U4B2_9GAMM|nr:EAL domain-containing protein [Lysobacter capsici]ALN86593.1 diguanylate cyclase domain protein [Lysobacter capsici]ATE72541.1 two-component system response regulator [Lysobacter capsici]KWS02304.1 two-component system response regulator [Lysobacter capsici AZ78]QWF15258.1 EAL domain-containing protein [Lysobacter capsici]UOF13109.1 EAL domain-containing protein [Lysobacter capsici]
MQFGKDMVLRLLIVDDSVEAAEAIVSALRNSGIAVRPTRPENEQELTALILQHPPDLVLAARNSRNVSMHKLMQSVDASGKDLPVLVLMETVDEAALLAVMEIGARGVVLRSNIVHLQNVVRAEWADLEARRSLRRLEAQVRETERRCDALIDSSRDPIAYIHEGMHIRANAAYLEIFGFESFEDIEGMSLLDLVAPGQVDGFKQLLKQLSKGDAPPPSYETQARALDGNAFPAVMEFTAATYEGEQCLQVVLRRQEIDPELAREVEAMRQRDQVTGLFNRATFLRSLEDAVADAAQNSAHHGLLLIEPDHYNQLLQEIGLDQADQLIKACGERLREAIGPDDVAARFGEHQFAVLTLHSDHSHTSELADKLREAFAGRVLETDHLSLSATASVGGVQIGEKIASVTAVLGKASQCLQSASDIGGNRTELFDPGAVDRAEEERIAAWVARIRDALDADRFVMNYQPLINLHGEPIEMYEAYLRMQSLGPDDSSELVQPLSFLQIAEEHGLLWEIDRWVVGKAIQVIGERMRQGRQTTLLVKITQASLQDESLQQHIVEQLAKHGADGKLLVLQLSESKVFTNLRAAQEFQSRVYHYGVRVGLEQFGAGLNSFQLLTHFDAAFLKIDRSYMEDLTSNPDHQQRVREIAEKARELGRQTVAEFVQDAASMSLLFAAGIDYAQGHFLAAAGPEMDYDFQ